LFFRNDVVIDSKEQKINGNKSEIFEQTVAHASNTVLTYF